MFFDFEYYCRLVGTVWRQRHWPGRRRMLLRLLIQVPFGYLLQSFFFLLDYLLFPALWRQDVKKPVFIIGHARSGTTMMHRLMSADGERFSSFLFWETYFPALSLKRLLRALGRIDRDWLGGPIGRRLEAWDQRTFGPWRHIHEQGLWIPEEDQFVMRATFVTQQWAVDLPSLHVNDLFHLDSMPAWRRRRWMRYYRACVKRQLLLNGGDRVHLSKNPVMSGWVESIIETFPDARFVVMMRDPLQCIPSCLKMMEQGWAARGWCKEDYRPSLEAMVQISFDSFTHPRAVLARYPQSPQIVVDYRELTGDPRGAVHAVYDALGLDLDSDYDCFLAQSQGAQRAHKTHHRYDIGDYDVEPARIESELDAFYEQYRWPRGTAAPKPIESKGADV